MANLSVRLVDGNLDVRSGSRTLLAIPSMDHPDFQRILSRGWVSPPSFGPAGDLRIYSAAHTAPGEQRYSWFASADWRRGRLQVDRRGAISDIAMAPYGAGKGKLRGDTVEVVPDYARGSIALTVNDDHSALGRWTHDSLELASDEGSSHVVDEPFGCALFLWCARPEGFLVRAKPPF